MDDRQHRYENSSPHQATANLDQLGVRGEHVDENADDGDQQGDEGDEHEKAYRRFVRASDTNSLFADTEFVHPKTWMKLGIRHKADTSERPRPGAGAQFFVIAPCHEMHHLHRALEVDLGAVTCLLCLMKMAISGH